MIGRGRSVDWAIQETSRIRKKILKKTGLIKMQTDTSRKSENANQISRVYNDMKKYKTKTLKREEGYQTRYHGI